MKTKIALMAIALAAYSTQAFAFGPQHAKGLSLSLGPGMGFQERYPGSDEIESNLVPYFDIEYATKKTTSFLSISDGLGLKYDIAYPGLFIAGGVNLGVSRSPDDADILKDTAEIANAASVFAKAGYESGFVDVVGTVTYYPIGLQYAGDYPDERKTGLLYTVACVVGYPVFNGIILSTEVGCSAMNEGYAQAYYGVGHATGRLEAYVAHAGMKDFYVEPTIMILSDWHFSLNVQGRYERAMGSAAKSPLAQTRNLMSGLIYLSYDL